jgi:hypothetical protein
LAPRVLPRFLATMGPSNTLSSSTDFLGAPVMRLPCSADFATGRGGLLQLLCVSLPSCCRFSPRQSGSPLQSGATIHAAFAVQLPARPLGPLTFEATSAFTFVTAQWLTVIPKDDLVDRLQRFSFLPPCYPSYEASDFCPGGTHLPLNTPAFAGHTTGRADFPHPAFRLDFTARLTNETPFGHDAVGQHPTCRRPHPLRSK